MSANTVGKQKTFWIWLLIIVAVIAGLLAFLDAARYMGWLPIAALGDLKFFLPSASWLGAGLAVITGLIWFWVARMLNNLDPRGWLFVAVIAVLNLVLLVLALIGQSTFQSISLALIVNLVALIIAILPSTKAAFGQ
jgi:hypothetical protein